RARGAKAVFVFPGQGSQWRGMGLELLDSAPVFADSLRACAEALSRHVDWSLEDVLRGAEGAPSLERVDVVQPALFAVMVSLASLWRGFGVEPAAVVGHSQGEIAAAHVAGGLSLGDAARIVCLRSQAVRDVMAGHGGMVSVALTPEAAQQRIDPYGERLSLAAVNGPSSVVVSGEVEALEELLAACEADGTWVRRIPVDYASHSAAVEDLRDRLAEDLEGIEPGPGSVPFLSTVTAELTDTAELDGDYWYRNLRSRVRFGDAVGALIADGATAFVEVSPNPGLTVGIEAAAEAAEAGERVAAIGTLRRDQGGLERFLTSLAEAHVHGAEVDWRTLFAGTGARRVVLPTYAFQRERYWLESRTGAGDVSAAGLGSVDHPLLGAAMRLVDEQGWALTGRVSLETHPWLRDHAVMGAVLFPGTAFVELALAAARHLGAAGLEDLALLAPLVLGERHSVQLQVTVAEPDEDGRRPVSVYSRPEGDESDGEWVLHASGLLGADDDGLPAGALDAFAAEAWPPEDAEEVDVALVYDRLADAGYDYGPVFQAVRSAFRGRDALYAEVALDGDGDAGGFCVHPALADAALHMLHVPALDQRDGDAPPEVPFSFSGVRLHREGVSSLRVRIETTGERDGDATAIGVLALDGSGAPAFAIEALRARPLDPAALKAHASAGRDSLFTLEWVEVETAGSDGAEPRVELLGGEEEGIARLEAAIAGGAPAPDVVLVRAADAPVDPLAAAVHDAAERTLALLKEWLASEALADSRLVLVTDGALAVSDGESPNLAQAALLGLMRSAMSENPLRFGVVDVDRTEASAAALQAASASEEPELALRDGTLYAPRLARASAEDQAGAWVPTPDGTVLVTGGTGGLGALVARHLAERGARRLLLTSRSGRAAEGAASLVEELEGLGCVAQVAACDVADREQLEALLAEIPQEHPLTAVVHAAGVLDDGVIGSLDSERLKKVMAPKVDGTLNLHELTKDRDLSRFVLFSSAAATFGSPGQGNYAAASAFLDAVAHHRRAQGLPATAVAWGTWERTSGMVTGADRARAERIGIAPLSDEQGLALFDTACGAARPLLVAASLDTGSLRAQAKAGVLPPVLQRLVRVSVRRGGESLARRLAGAPEPDREPIVLDLVRGHVATVLGHGSPHAIDMERPFKDLGFDSLSAVELRNRLVQASGLKLPPTLVFDHPTPAAVARYLREKVARADRAAPVVRRTRGYTDEPIAIVGMSCRFPGGVDSPERLWELVAEGRDAMTEFPADRGWDLDRLFDPDPDHPGTSYSRHGGFIDGAGEFDAGFFSISPREALAMEPQQRLLLEGAWEAFEDAGIAPAALRGSHTGVFVGITASDYGIGARGQHELEGFRLTGNSASVASGRLAYTFGLEGPAVSVDTACSASLVALHLACQALRRGECELALAGGATVQASPALFVEFARQRGLSPDGRCKAFGAGADGTGFSEGTGLLVVERLSDALANGHEVLAVVRGSAVNQDGASNGLTAPNGPSQERVIQQALASSGLTPSDVDAVEAHGTGTTLGDPIEAQALLATYGQERSNGPLHLGSIKSNIGHSVAAAGVAGVIKMVQALRHERLPATLHADEPSPHVDWSAGAVELLREPVEWPAGERPRRAAVSSFAISGTNAHVILEEPPAVERPPGDDGEARPVTGGALPFLVSARSAGALAEQAGRLASFLESRPEAEPYEVASALALRRDHLGHRAACVAGGLPELVAGLRALERGEPAGGVVGGVASGAGPVAFLFSGQGSQWAGMGAALYREFPVFAQALDEVCAELDPRLERPLLEVMFAAEGSPEAGLLSETRFTQVALFALEVALHRLLRSFGVAPEYLIGHSIGEFAAAYVAGIFSLADGCRLVAERARLMGALPAGGAMLAVEASEEEIRASLEGLEDRLALAAVNGPTAVVVSGAEDAIADFEASWRARERRTRRLHVSHAFHSPLMEPMLEELLAVAGEIELSAPAIPIVSNVTGAELTAEQARSPEYWVRHVRETVRFADGVETLRAAGVRRFLELGPDGTLTALAAQSADDDERLFVSTLRGSKTPQREALLTFLVAAHCDGLAIDWRALLDDRGLGRVELPTYAFQRERYWLESTGGHGDPAAAGQAAVEHPLLGALVRLAGEEGWLLTGRLALATHPWLADHAVLDTVIVPGTAFVELALAAAERLGAGDVEDLTLLAPLELGE
ncbi:MAG: SDR family NAD(P)-dependent oxidoreductase, partial [Actinomycetota bacterium]|nr:SDR family NAD(P)-dependent oxidoreductase [Actinomycetota bacterium]